MILVDSSVWIDFFNGADTPHVDVLESWLRADEVVVADLIVAEVLQGYRDDRSAVKAWSLLQRFSLVRIGGFDLALSAAANYRTLRARGITVRKTIDTLIATWCIRHDRALLHRDRDFDPFVAHLGLRAVSIYN